ncbi:hypothetical protein N1851_025794 [Merluccius polli]|uniref:THAP-type domain-containing protein n=1 Tax=Merluccius polli TaxID=89951 RepID=A0AA47NTJ5_MERPO|nr:hypothetical protein N1851_025794 [Merluccius polli]
MPTCSAVGCENRTSSGVKFFRIPAGSHPFKKNRRHLWLQALKREDWDNAAAVKEARICSAHFISVQSDEELPPVSRSEYDNLHLKLQEDYINLQQECFKLRIENDSLKQKLNQSKLTYCNVKSNFRQLLFFTGLTSIIFEWLIEKLSSELSHHSLPLEDQLLMVLMKLRLGLSNLDLAYRFNVANSTVVGV